MKFEIPEFGPWCFGGEVLSRKPLWEVIVQPTLLSTSHTHDVRLGTWGFYGGDPTAHAPFCKHIQIDSDMFMHTR